MTVVTKEIADRISGGWESGLHLTPTKAPRAILANVMIALRGAPEWQGVLAYDEFAMTTMLMRPPPWVKTNGNWEPRAWTDSDDTLATEWMHSHGVCVASRVTAESVSAVATEHSFHPVRDYLEGLRWGGTPRLDAFSHTYLGAADSPYHTAVNRCTLVGGVARVMEPGCKLDTVMILEQEQGKNKSTAIEALTSPWFTDEIAELGTKDSAMQLRSRWCIEIAELSAMTRGEVERVKAFVSRRVDRYRPSYGRHVIEVPRQCFFIGSTNAEVYLKDDTGGRRYLPVRCGKIDVAAIKRDRDQIWAEAVHMYRKGVPWWVPTAIEVDAREQQRARQVVDAWEHDIAVHVASKQEVTVAEILEDVIGLSKERWGQLEQNRVASCLRLSGFKRVRGPRSADGSPRPWVYRRDST